MLNLLGGQEVDRPACYSGMGSVTTVALEKLGCRFHELHNDANKMALAGASSYRLFGYESAVIPFDVCVEAEALGCTINFYENVDQLLYPTIKQKIIHSEEDISSLSIPVDFLERGRINLVCEAIRMIKRDIGQEVAIGTFLLDPFTLAGQLIDLNDLYKLSYKKPDKLNILLDRLADVQIAIGKKYCEAGVDYITMGAVTDSLNFKAFEKVIAPHLKKIFVNLPGNNVLHLSGETSSLIKIKSNYGASALSLEYQNDIAKIRAEIAPDGLIFGQMNANALVSGNPADIVKAVLASLDAGVDALWPGGDICPDTPLENLIAMVDTVKEHGASRWVRRNKIRILSAVPILPA